MGLFVYDPVLPSEKTRGRFNLLKLARCDLLLIFPLMTDIVDILLIEEIISHFPTEELIQHCLCHQVPILSGIVISHHQ